MASKIEFFISRSRWRGDEKTCTISYRRGTLERQLFSVELWGMSCCGVHILKGLTFVSLSKEEWIEFFAWFEKEKEAGNIGDQWNPGEFYFLLSDSGVESKQDTLLSLGNVKKIDSFENHAHGPYRLHLYRYSRQKDF